MAKQEIRELKKHLRNGEVTFEYKKKDGALRTARGTLNFGMIPHGNWGKQAPTSAPDNVRYWDLDSEGWRSFIPDNFVRIVGSVQNGWPQNPNE